MKDPAMQELSDATTALSEATSSCMGHLAAQNPELIDWASAVEPTRGRWRLQWRAWGSASRASRPGLLAP